MSIYPIGSVNKKEERVLPLPFPKKPHADITDYADLAQIYLGV